MDTKNILVANRGIVAQRIMRTCKEMGFKTIGIYTDNDFHPNTFNYADKILKINNLPDKSGYMNQDEILKIAIENKAAIHTGYGFLSENYEFALKCEENNINFIGPSAKVLKIAGNKSECIRLVSEKAIPTVPSFNCSELTEEIIEIAERVGFPLLIKPSFGGGGIGMTVVNNKKELDAQIKTITEISKKYFGKPDLLIEKYLPNSKHIEVQILGDKHGNVVHLLERECSMQRRKQKVLEETPSPSINETQRQYLYDLAIKIAKILEIDNVSTIEFLYHDNQFYFLEVNPRLQVEHGITEEITDIDLVEWQLRIENGERVTSLENINYKGHSLEARIYAESPYNDLPAPGTIEYLSLPTGKGLRIESYIKKGSLISQEFDSLLLKVITHGNDRKTAIFRLNNALKNLDINSDDTLNVNTMRLLKAIENTEFLNGTYTTDLFEQLNLKESNLEKELATFISESFYTENNVLKTKTVVQNNNSYWRPSFWHT